MLNAYYPLGHNPGGFRTWWRHLHSGSGEQPDNTHLMRMAGRFSRRIRAWAKTNQVPVIDYARGERKHWIAEEYLATRTMTTGVFLILVAKTPARRYGTYAARPAAPFSTSPRDKRTSTTTRSTSWIPSGDT